jgi:hypothetical protein
MHIILDHIWTVVKKTLKKRIMIVDEAWYLMQFPDSAAFLRGIVKRGRKYYLGVTTITQDVDDFLKTPYGKEIVTNSAIQILLKQHSAAIDQIGEVFYLSEGEKQLLLTADKGEGIFFAGQNHVAIKVIASEDEHKLITSNPEEVMQMKKTVDEKRKVIEEVKPVLVNKPIAENIGQVVEIATGPKMSVFQPKVEDTLQKRIKEMEEQEKKEIEEHRKKLDVEEKESKNQSLGGFGTLPKYQDLFKPATNKLPPLPPLPPLPKYEPVIKPEAVVEKEEVKKPIFITPEPKIPQPPQLMKKNKPEFVTQDQNKTETPQTPEDKKTNLTYDKLFGDGIV